MSNQKRMCDRTVEFGCAVIGEYRRLDEADEAERVLWSELLKSQKSMIANSGESDGAHSRRDFVLKFQICLKEAREAAQLLRTLSRICPRRNRELQALTAQCSEIIAVLVSSLKTAKRRIRKTD